MDFFLLLLLLNHLLNFVAPALFLGLLLALGGWWLQPHQPRRAAPVLRLSWPKQAAINSAVGCVVLLLGLLHGERDGKILTYTALVLGCASSQWIMLRPWWHSLLKSEASQRESDAR